MSEKKGDWMGLLTKEITGLVVPVLSELSFSRMRWLRENFDTVAAFLRGDLDKHLKGKIPPMPAVKHDDPEVWLFERELTKTSKAP